MDDRTRGKAFWDGFRMSRDEWEFWGALCRVVAMVAVLGCAVLGCVVALALILCSCAPNTVTNAPNIDALSEHADSLAYPRAPWSPGGRPLRIMITNVEPGTYFGYVDDSPFLFGFLYDRDKPRYVLEMQIMTGIPNVMPPCVIEIRKSDGGRPNDSP
ncbi:MAG: hypothetical protein GY906_17985 [bacterium]|nr:hypothetical protein [bacterium]